MNLLWQYRYGKPGEAEKENNAPKITAPVINFYASTDQIKELDNTIDITPEEDVDYDEYTEEENE
jgi:hypothetical protein